MALILSDSICLETVKIFSEPSEKSIPKIVITRSKQKRHSSVNLQKRFMKNNKPVRHCQEEIVKQGRVVCGLESTKSFFKRKSFVSRPLPCEQCFL